MSIKWLGFQCIPCKDYYMPDKRIHLDNTNWRNLNNYLKRGRYTFNKVWHKLKYINVNEYFTKAGVNLQIIIVNAA